MSVMADRQTEADMVGTICDLVDELSSYLDKFHSVASDKTFAAFEKAWPEYVDIGTIGRAGHKHPLAKLYWQLENGQ